MLSPVNATNETPSSLLISSTVFLRTSSEYGLVIEKCGSVTCTNFISPAKTTFCNNNPETKVIINLKNKFFM